MPHDPSKPPKSYYSAYERARGSRPKGQRTWCRIDDAGHCEGPDIPGHRCIYRRAPSMLEYCPHCDTHPTLDSFRIYEYRYQGRIEWTRDYWCIECTKEKKRYNYANQTAAQRDAKNAAKRQWRARVKAEAHAAGRTFAEQVRARNPYYRIHDELKNNPDTLAPLPRMGPPSPPHEAAGEQAKMDEQLQASLARYWARRGD